jgi:hypothetical protein
MSIFSKKQEVNLEDFCRDFYEKNILNPVIAGIDVGTICFDSELKLVIEADQSFANIDSQKFATEMIPLRFEVIALAWLHQFGDKSAVAQSTFTKNYLREKKRDDIWDAIEPYNQAIARSSTAVWKTSKNAFARVYLARVNLTRADLFDQYYKEGYDPECVTRVLNRLFTDAAWKRDITANFLMFTLCDYLGFKSNEPNKETQFRLTGIIHGLYNGSRQSLEEIKIKN